MIDAHAHLDQLDGRRSTAADLLTLADALGVQQILTYCGDEPHDGRERDEVELNLACLQEAKRQPRLVPLYWARPGRLDSHPAVLIGAVSREPFVGAVFSPWRHGYGLADKTLLAPYVDGAARLARPAVIRTAPREHLHPGELLALARRNSDVPLVLSGALKNIGRRELFDALRHAALRRETNIVLDTVGASSADIRDALDVIGPERLLFATDGGGSDEGRRHALQTVIRELREQLPPATFELVTHGNAVRVFHLRAARSVPPAAARTAPAGVDAADARPAEPASTALGG